MVYEVKRKKINGVFMALFFSLTNIASIISSVITINYISVALAGLLLIALVLSNKKFLIDIKAVSIWFAIFLSLLLSILFNGLDNVLRYFLFFISFGTVGALIVQYKFDIKTTFDSLGIIYFIHLLVYFIVIRSNFLSSTQFWNEQMGVAYSFVPSIFVSISALFILKRKGIIKVLLNLFNLFAALFVILFDCGTRGAIFAAFAGSFFVLIFNTKLPTRRKWLIALVILTLFVFIFSNFIIGLLVNIFKNTNIVAIEKFLYQLQEGDITSGRKLLYEQFFIVFSRSFLIGNGVGYFESLNGGLYVHQLFLQVAMEFGIVGLIALLWLLIKVFAGFLSERDRYKNTFYIVLFSASFFCLLISNSYWLLPNFWLFFFYSFTIFKKQKSKNRIVMGQKNYATFD